MRLNHRHKLMCSYEKNEHLQAQCGTYKLVLYILLDNVQARIQGGPGGPPPLTLGFEAPKQSNFGPYYFFFASLHSAYYFFNVSLSKFKFKNFPALLQSAYDFSPRSLCFQSQLHTLKGVLYQTDVFSNALKSMD